jgi:hypothetical protein
MRCLDGTDGNDGAVDAPIRIGVDCRQVVGALSVSVFLITLVLPIILTTDHWLATGVDRLMPSYFSLSGLGVVFASFLLIRLHFSSQGL